MRSTPKAARFPIAALALAMLVAGCTAAGSPDRHAGHGADHAEHHAEDESTIVAMKGHIMPPEWTAELTAREARLAPAALSPDPLPRQGWVATASDEESARENGVAANVLDGNASTIWHSRWSGTPAPLPHSITLDMRERTTISALRYTPRTGSSNGRIGRFEIHVSTNGTDWGTPVTTGTWADNALEKTAQFSPVAARFVRLTALTAAANRGQYTAVAELNVFAEAAANEPEPPPVPAPGVLPRTGWTASATDEETAKENGRAQNVLDGNRSTLWHSQYSPSNVRLPHSVVIDMRAAHEVSGLTYTPRSGTNRNGTIGRYTVAVSSNGTTWSAAVATGTWADTAAAKTATFPAVQARYVRLTANSEAGGRGQWSSAAEIDVLGRALSAPVDPPPQPAGASKGSWGAPIGFPLVPAAAALLPGDKLLTWSAYSNTNFGGSRGYTQTAILDLKTGLVTPLRVSNTMHDMFCPGVSILPDGRILVSGGSNAGATSIYDPAKNTWTAAAPMKIPRAYQSNVTLSNGEVFTLGGSWTGGHGGKHGEVWSAAGGWRRVDNASVTPILTKDPQGVFRSDNHAWLFAGADGTVFQAGPSKQMNMYTTAGKGSVTALGSRADSGDAMNGNAVMYDVGKIITMGGSPAYQDSDATARAYAIDINDGVNVTRVGDMAARRAFANATVLPDGQVLVAGGQARAVPFSDATAAMAPELWNPATGKFTTLAPMAVPRTYHSLALLLPDARVFVGGGGLCGSSCTTNHPNGEIFTPPYLLDADGTARPRPAITAAPATAALGSSIQVTTSRATPTFSLIRMSTVTHSINTDQRRIPLTPTAVSGNTATLRIPGDPGVVIPGPYLLFAMDADGVPSVAATIRIG
jgi:galactose oxidase